METLTQQQVKAILQNAPKGSNPGMIVQALADKGYKLEGFNDQPEPVQAQPQQKDGIVKSIAKDVVGTLLVKPAARAAEVVGRTGILGEDVKKGYEEMAKTGESQNFAGIEVPAVKAFGEGGGKQIAGETLKVGSYLFPYGKVAGAVGGKVLGSASKLTPTAIKTAKVAGNVASGATGGFMGGFGQGLSDDKTLGESLKLGGATALVGGAIPLVSPALSAGKKALTGSKTTSDVTKRIIQGQTKDIPLAEQAFKNINTKGVKTRQELSQRLSDAMGKSNEHS